MSPQLIDNDGNFWFVLTGDFTYICVWKYDDGNKFSNLKVLGLHYMENYPDLILSF